MHVTDIDNPFRGLFVLHRLPLITAVLSVSQHSTFYKETKKSRMKDFY